jgi:hypothetical protein
MFITFLEVSISLGGIQEPLVQSESTQPTANGIANYPCILSQLLAAECNQLLVSGVSCSGWVDIAC